jgi:hypothetical protein
MSEAKSNREQSDPKKMPERPRDLAELAALVVSNLTSMEPGEESRSLIVFVWRDGAMMIKFPSGRKMFVYPAHGKTLESTIHELAVGAITEYCKVAAIAVAEIRVHVVPTELSTGGQILAWLQALPGISIAVLPPNEIGFGGPLPPTGEAG